VVGIHSGSVVLYDLRRVPLQVIPTEELPNQIDEDLCHKRNEIRYFLF